MVFFSFLLEYTAIRFVFEFAAISAIYLVYSWMSGDAFLAIRQDERQPSFHKRVWIRLESRMSLVILGLLSFLLAAYNAADCIVQDLTISESIYFVEFLRWTFFFDILAVLLPKSCFYSPDEDEDGDADRQLVTDMVGCIFAFLISVVGNKQARRVLDNICDVWDSDQFSDEMVDKMLDLARKVDGNIIEKGKAYAKLYFSVYFDSLHMGGEAPAWTPSNEERECHSILKDAIFRSLKPAANSK